MLGRTLHEYIFIRICITLLQYPVILYMSALAGCLLSAVLNQPDTGWETVACWVIGLMSVEMVYGLFIWLPYKRRLREAATHPAPSSPVDRQALFDRCMATVPDPERYLRLWFLGAELTDIRRDNVRDFFRWAFFDQGTGSKPSSDDSSEIDSEVDQYVVRIEELMGRSFEPGRGRADCLRLTLDDIEARYRSVWWYAILALVDAVTHVLLVWNGFQYYAQPVKEMFNVFPPRVQQLFSRRRSSVGNLSYWHRPHQQPEGLPVLFLHGIGIGLWPYIRFLADTSSGGKGNVEVIALEILPVSFRLTKPPLNKQAFLEQLTGILDHHGWDRFVLVSHSYGSVLTTHAIQSPELQARIPRAVLIDPVSILLHLPDVAFNFTRRRPKSANEWQLWYFASMDPGVAHCLGRCFFWRENIIWTEELIGRHTGPEHAASVPRLRADERGARQVTVCLSGQDLIVDSHAVARYLAESEQTGDAAWLQGEMDKRGRRNVAGSLTSPVDDIGRGRSCSVRSGVDVLWFPQQDHGQVFDSSRDSRRVVDVVRGYCEE